MIDVPYYMPPKDGCIFLGSLVIGEGDMEVPYELFYDPGSKEVLAMYGETDDDFVDKTSGSHPAWLEGQRRARQLGYALA